MRVIHLTDGTSLCAEGDPDIRSGDVFTMAGVLEYPVREVPSGRKWWQLWKPRTAFALKRFTVQ